MDMMETKLRVWHVPQIPCKSFYVPVSSPDEAIKILNVLADYDLFQLDNNIKPDYSSAQGLEEWDETEQEWIEWTSEDGLEIREYKERSDKTKRCCGTCLWDRCVQSLTKYTCCNESSPYYAQLTDECHVCGK